MVRRKAYRGGDYDAHNGKADCGERAWAQTPSQYAAQEGVHALTSFRRPSPVEPERLRQRTAGTFGFRASWSFVWTGLLTRNAKPSPAKNLFAYDLMI